MVGIPLKKKKLRAVDRIFRARCVHEGTGYPAGGGDVVLISQREEASTHMRARTNQHVSNVSEHHHRRRRRRATARFMMYQGNSSSPDAKESRGCPLLS